MDFKQALNTVFAQLTPQPWEHATPEGTTLTVIPAGLREDAGQAEVYVRITVDKALAVEVGVTTTDLPALIDALEQRSAWEHSNIMRDRVEVTFDADGLVLVVEEDDGRWGVLRMPEQQRMPLASALRRALDVARDWES